jgi:hypothetical protein
MEQMSLPQDPIPAEELQHALLEVLSRGEISDEDAGALIAELSELEVLRSYPMKPFPKGIIVRDGISIQIILDREGLRGLSKALFDIDRLEKFEYFPYGIVDPQVFVGRAEFRV